MELMGKLKNGNPSGDPHSAPRCEAHSRRTGNPCRAPAVKGRLRCRMHGGKSTGAKTPEGIEKVRKANWIHGGQSFKAKESRRVFRQMRQETRMLMEHAVAGCRKLYRKPKKV